MSPFSLMRRFTEEMDQLFDQIGFGRGSFGAGAQGGQGWQGSQGALQRGGGALGQAFFSPQVEVFERDGKLIVRADLPGLTKDDVHVQVTEDALVIEGERRYEHEDNEGGVYRSERSYGRFRRVVPLPEGVNAEQARASFRNGVLEVAMPTPQQQQRAGRRIEIQGDTQPSGGSGSSQERAQSSQERGEGTRQAA